MKSTDSAGVTFVNVLLGSGTLNGVVNLQFGTYQFTPNEFEEKVDADLVVSCRLRMDFTCLKQLHENLTKLIEQAEQAAKSIAANDARATERLN